MEPKMIFLDIDGTLSFPGKSISKQVKNGIREARKNGHLVFICTGRPIRRIPEEILRVGFDGIVASAGGYIKVGDQLIEQSFIPDDVVDKMIDVFNQCNMMYDIETEDLIYSANGTEEFLDEMISDEDVSGNSELARMKEFRRMTAIGKFEDYLQKRPGVYKSSFIAKSKDDVEKAKKLLEEEFHFVRFHFPGMVEVFFNGEVNYKGISKGRAIEVMVDYFHKDIKNTIGFGDSMNDYEMIKTAGYGVAMDNADDELKEIADKVCESVQDDGVYKELQRLGIVQ